jgi:hypothetical protein
MYVVSGLKLMVSLVIISAVCGFFLGVTREERSEPNRDRYGCMAGQLPSGHTLVFVDRTDAYSASQIQAFRNEMSRIDATVKPGEMLTVASIGGEIPAVINFRACSPERGEVLGLIESLRRNRDWLEIERDYEEEFQQPIQTLAGQMALDLTMPYSPIIQSMAGVMEQLGPQWGRVSRRKVTIISDLIENTQAFSQYDTSSNEKPFAQVRNDVPYIRESALDLSGAAVTVLCLTGIPHDSGLQGAEQQRFWRDLVAFYGGEVCDWIVVPASDGISH